MKLRPYHNPENVDESTVPDGWRFRYADEAGTCAPTKCKCWGYYGREFRAFSSDSNCAGNSPTLTYIVPVS
jgi:hypothetical protein